MNQGHADKTAADCPGTDGLYEYKWDAEHRLIEAVPVTPSNAPPGNKKVKFVYDYMGRRVRKDVFYYSGGWPADDNPNERWHFVYDGWNVVMVLNGNNETVRKYTWGLDLSGTIHGAGGIGGLLACEEPQAVGDPKRYWFFYDANGNVGQVLDATNMSTITLAAHYEYDPYGNLINSSGPYADANPIRFSTKWFDAETDLGYWGYRYYSPRLGRWMSRDPMGEMGGKNLYSFIANQVGNGVDFVGLWNIGNTGVHGGLTATWAREAGMINDHCVDIVRRWNEGVDEVTPAWFFPEYHFEFGYDGRHLARGRNYWGREWWRQAIEILGPIVPRSFAYGLAVELGLQKAGEALHSIQDSSAHQLGGRNPDPRFWHFAETPFDHCPRRFCSFFWWDTRCATAQAHPNWANESRPDDEVLFQDDVTETGETTRALIRTLMEIPAVRCYCGTRD